MKIRGIISNSFDLDKCYPGHDSEQQEILAVGHRDGEFYNGITNLF